MSDIRKGLGISTRAILAGEAPDPSTGASAPSSVMSSAMGRLPRYCSQSASTASAHGCTSSRVRERIARVRRSGP